MADQSASVFGQGCFHAGQMKISLGTGSFLDVNTGTDIHASMKGLVSSNQRKLYLSSTLLSRIILDLYFKHMVDQKLLGSDLFTNLERPTSNVQYLDHFGPSQRKLIKSNTLISRFLLCSCSKI